jgi:hypothetical protein
MKYQIGIIIACMFLMPTAVLGKDAAKAESEIKTVKIVLHPMSESQPAQKYKLLPPFIDLKPGNAAVFYNKVPTEASSFFGDEKLWDNIDAWTEAPLSELKKKEIQTVINGWTWQIRDLKRAAHCEYCDWQLPIREFGYETPLPEVQQTRSYARLLAVTARFQIANGQYNEAIQAMRSGYALGRHVSNGPTFIHNLVGCAIVNIISEQVQELIQQPEAPNLYWALTDLPRPIIDFRSGVDGEYAIFYLSFPDLQNLETKELAPEQWPVLLNQTMRKINRIGSGSSPPELGSAFSTALLIEKYPLAKAFLIERGWAAVKVEDMPVCQVVLIAGLRQYEEIQDELFKWMYLPYPDAIAGMKKSDVKMRDIFRSGQEILPLASLLLPAISAAKAAEARTEREIAVLRIFEALRLYTAAHEGQLPEKLSDITEVPIPMDPIHGTPFIYHYLMDNTVILEAPRASGLNPEAYWLRYEIHLESKGK